MTGNFTSTQTLLPVAVDTTGGDRGLDVVVEGAVLAFKEFDVHSILVGPQDALKARLDALGAGSLRIPICHAPETIGMQESPTRAVRRKPDSSLCVAYNLVESGQASSIISAGNSGAMMAAGRIICGLMSGIERPAIATLIPVVGNGMPNVILDTGANVDCHAQNLVQFAVMGSIYCSTLFNVPKPRVALLSNGSEASKGNDVVRAAAGMLSSLESVNYVGYVEGRDIPSKAANVIVCDGFTGNIVLKSLEGCVRLIFDQLMLESRKGPLRMLGMALCRGVYREVFSEKFDYSAYGGAPLLGLRKLGVVLHGSSDKRAVKNALKIACDFAQKRMTDRIGNELAKLEELTADFGAYTLPGGFGKRKDSKASKAAKLDGAREENETEQSDIVAGDEP